MDPEMIGQQLETTATRRQVVKTGVKLAYAVPLVAATFKLSSGGTMAASPPCEIGDCDNPELCGGSATCVCRAQGCLQDIFCGDTAVCISDSQCPGGFCIPDAENCCGEGVGYCVYPCGEGPVSIADSSEGRGSILGLLGSKID